MKNGGYIKTYTDFLGGFLNPQKKMAVVFDCSNGSSGPILKQLAAGKNLLKFYFINQKPDGHFPGHGPDPLNPKAREQLQRAVKKYKADLGVVFDADADRAFFVDNLGRQINPDVIGYLLTIHINPKKIVIDIRSGWLLKKMKGLLPAIKISISRVGSYYIKELMRETESEFAAEFSGHYYFTKEFWGADSGILAAIYAISAASKLPYPLSQFVDFLPHYYRAPETNFRIENIEKTIKNLKKYFVSKSAKINNLDGLTVESDEFWCNVRPSNTEPLLRTNVEAISEGILNQKLKELGDIISHPKS